MNDCQIKLAIGWGYDHIWQEVDHDNHPVRPGSNPYYVLTHICNQCSNCGAYRCEDDA